MSIIKAEIDDQNLTLTEMPSIYHGDVETDTVKFEFNTENWNNYVKTAIFYIDEKEGYQVLLKNNECVIPHEVLQKKGYFYFGIMGTSGTKVITTEAVRYKVGLGASTEKYSNTEEPTPNIYNQIMADYSEMKVLADQWNKKVDPSIRDAINAKNQCLDAIASLNNEIYDMDGGDPFTASYSDDCNGGYPT